MTESDAHLQTASTPEPGSRATVAPGEVPDATDERIGGRVIAVAGVVVLSTLLAMLDLTIVNVALPTFQTELSPTGSAEPLPYSTVAWIVTGYSLAVAAAVPLTGWVIARFGTKRAFLWSLATFTAASILCALAWDIYSLIAFRVIQGFGGGIMLPVGSTVLRHAAGPHRIGRLMAPVGIAMLIGPITGPVIGGWIVEAASWQWVFLAKVPLGIIAVMYAALVLQPERPEKSESLDVIGVLLMCPGLALAVLGISLVPVKGRFNDPAVYLSLGLGVVLITVFAFRSFRIPQPLLDLRLLGSRDIAAPVSTSFVFNAAFFGAMLLLPTFFQVVRGESPVVAGAYVAVEAIGTATMLPISGRLTDRIAIGRFVPAGVGLIVLTMGAITLLASDTTPTLVLVLLIGILGLGNGFAAIPLNSGLLKRLRDDDVARGATLMNITNQTGSAFGIAILSVVLASNLTTVGEIDNADAFALAFGVATVMCLVAFLASLLLPRKDAMVSAQAVPAT